MKRKPLSLCEIAKRESYNGSPVFVPVFGEPKCNGKNIVKKHYNDEYREARPSTVPFTLCFKNQIFTSARLKWALYCTQSVLTHSLCKVDSVVVVPFLQRTQSS